MRTMIVLCLVLTCPIAHAQDEPDLPSPEELAAPCAPEVEEHRRATLEHAGVEGLWFHPDVARCLLGRYALLPPFARLVWQLEARAELDGRRDALLRREASLAAEEAEEARAALDPAIRRAREAEEELNAWYRAPELWVVVVAVGVIVGAGAGYLLAADLP